ncbi:MAG: FG-GAP-like repeat-containing protein [Methylococcales bacterium]|nr:FG-GAP-like repeat-containing protein [Methylococcales bacterium]
MVGHLFHVTDGWTFIPSVNVTGDVLLNYVVSDGVNTNTATANLFINAINDAPSSVDSTITLLEDSTYTFSLSDFGFLDAQDTPSNNFIAVRISYVSNGSIQLNGVEIFSGQSISVSDISAGKLSFTPLLNGNGSSYASLGFSVQDDGGIANGGFDTSFEKVVTIKVTPVNDAPKTQAIYLGSTSENQSIAVTTAKLLLGASDIDLDSLSITNLSLVDANQGTLVGDITSGWIFTPSLTYKGNVNFNYTVSDGVLSSSNTATLLVTPSVGGGSFPSYSEQTFSIDDGSGIAYNARALTTLDINGDGRLDIVTFNIDSNTISVFSNNNSGGFDTPIVYSTNSYAGYYGGGNYQNTMVTGDINGDGKTDLVVSNGDNTLSVFINNGIGGFESSYVLQGTGFSVVLADINNDGKVDILSGGNAGVYALLNNGEGIFTGQTITNVYPINTFALADFNKDGNVDMVAIDPTVTNQTISILTSDGNGGFNTVSQYSLGVAGIVFQAWNNSIVTTDVNGDGFIDIVTAINYRNKVSVLINNGNGGFNPAIVSSIGVGASRPGSLVVADINGDGAVDIVTVNTSRNISVLLNTGTGNFNPANVLSISGFDLSGLSVGDFDGDGKSDIVTAYPNNNAITVVTPIVCQAPEGIDANITTDTTYIFKVSDFGFTDVNSNSLVAVKISSLPVAGLLVYDGRVITQANITTGFNVITADLVAGKLTYQPAM